MYGGTVIWGKTCGYVPESGQFCFPSLPSPLSTLGSPPSSSFRSLLTLMTAPSLPSSFCPLRLLHDSPPRTPSLLPSLANTPDSPFSSLPFSVHTHGGPLPSPLLLVLLLVLLTPPRSSTVYLGFLMIQTGPSFPVYIYLDKREYCQENFGLLLPP